MLFTKMDSKFAKKLTLIAAELEYFESSDEAENSENKNEAENFGNNEECVVNKSNSVKRTAFS